jgi:hypothetical protein
MMLVLVLIVVMVVALAFGIVAFVIVVVMVMMLVLVLVIVEFEGLSGAVDNLKDLLAVKHIPGRRNYDSVRVLFAEHRNDLVYLFRLHSRRAAEDDGVCVCYLVIVKFAEVFHVHFAFCRIRNGCRAANLDIVTLNLGNSSKHVGKLAYAGGLDNYSVGVELFDNLRHSLAEIADEAAADATGIHFRYLDSGILQKAAVYANLAEFVFDKHKLFARISFLDKLFDERCFTRAQKTGKNIYFRHFINPSFFAPKRIIFF